MPLGRAHVGHRLDGLVLGRERGGQRLGEPPGGAEPIGQDLVVHGRQQVGHPRSFRLAWGSDGGHPARDHGELTRNCPAMRARPARGGTSAGGVVAGQFRDTDRAVTAASQQVYRRSRRWESNPRPDDYKSSALPTAPHRHGAGLDLRSPRPSVRSPEPVRGASSGNACFCIRPVGRLACSGRSLRSTNSEPSEPGRGDGGSRRAVRSSCSCSSWWRPCCCSAASTPPPTKVGGGRAHRGPDVDHDDQPTIRTDRPRPPRPSRPSKVPVARGQRLGR